MRRSTPAVVLTLLTLAACADDPSAPDLTPAPTRPAFAQGAQPGEPIPDRYIVVLRDDAGGPEGVPGLARRLARESGGTVGYVYEHAVRGFSVALDAKGAAQLARHPLVASVEQDQVATASLVQAGATWGLDRIDQRALPLSTTFAYTRTGAGVTAYIVDTGILYGHAEFAGRAVAGYDALGGTGADCNGHGTHVSGTVGGTTYGVAKAVRLVAVRVLDCRGSGTNAGVIAGVDWVTADHVAGTPAVANMSLGGGASSTLDQAVQRAIADGVTFAVAAGNGNFLGWAQNACNYSPARVPEAITVSATDKTDKKASYANYGTCVDLFAPGNSITSSWYTSATATNTISGTSMAAPHVAGVAALYLEGAPAATPQQVRDAIVAGATTGVVTSAGTGSPNRLLYTAY
jgi:subtilisin family serine protease